MISSKETLQATTLQGCRYPHTLSCSPHKVSSHERLGLLVELSAFLHCAEDLDLQFLPCLCHCKHPGVLLSFQGLLLAHDTSMLVLDQGSGSQATLGLADLSCEGLANSGPC